MPETQVEQPARSSYGRGLLCQRDAIDFICRDLGLPMSGATFHRLRAAGDAPKPAGQWGRRILYDPADLQRWARQRAQAKGSADG